MPHQASNDETASIAEVRFEHRGDALGIGTAKPRLSWIVATQASGWRQAGYEIEAYGPDTMLQDQTGRIESDQSVLVPWPFAPLASRERRTIRLCAWGTDGQATAWSSPTSVEAGLLHSEDWAARFVTPDWDEDTSSPQPSPLLRRAFVVRTGVARARLYATALGVYEAQINGCVVGDHVLDPGWTSYNHRLRCQTFDVTDLLREGPNAIGAMLGEGWFCAGWVSAAAAVTSMATELRCWPSSRSPTPMAQPTASSAMTPGAPRAARSWPAASTTARPTTPAWSEMVGRPRVTTIAIG